jgi:hypothetical protein
LAEVEHIAPILDNEASAARPITFLVLQTVSLTVRRWLPVLFAAPFGLRFIPRILLIMSRLMLESVFHGVVEKITCKVLIINIGGVGGVLFGKFDRPFAGGPT